MEWGEVLKGIVGGKRRLRFWNKHQKIELLFMQLARYNSMHERVLKYQKKYQKNWLINKIYQDIKLILCFPIYSSPAAWAKDLWSEVCFRSIAWFSDPHYLSRTSHHSIQCAWNSRIWNFEFRKTLLPLRNLWKLKVCSQQPGRTSLTGPGAVLVLIQNKVLFDIIIPNKQKGGTGV